jgi:hypothetical protein
LSFIWILKIRAALRRSPVFPPEAALDCLHEVDAFKDASEIVACIASLYYPGKLAKFAGIKETRVIGLAAHILVLVSLEFTVISYFHHLWQGISREY